MNRLANPTRRRVLAMIAAGAFVPGCSRWPVPVSVSAEPATAKTYRFVNGLWFDGARFRPDLFHSVAGMLSREAPEKVDEVVDLAGGYVVPPFADAHTHHFDNPANIAEHVAKYLRDGVFYAKVQTDVRTRAQLVADRVNRSDSIDVSYAHGGLSASNGHPLATYESLALFGRPSTRSNEIQTVRGSRLVDNDAYYIIDTADDLTVKWPSILAGRPDFIKIYLLNSEEFEKRRDRANTVGDRGLDPKLVPLIVAKAHAARLRVSAHVNTAADYRVALNAGVDEMAHVPGFGTRSITDPRSYLLTDADAEQTARRQIWVIPAPAYAPARDPQHPSFDAEAKERADAVRIGNLTLLKKHGVKVALGSDSFGRTPVKDALDIAALGVFSNAELLKIWCEDTPRTIFPERKIGRLADFHEASFLALSDDPTTRFASIATIRFRFKQGMIV